MSDKSLASAEIIPSRLTDDPEPLVRFETRTSKYTNHSLGGETHLAAARVLVAELSNAIQQYDLKLAAEAEEAARILNSGTLVNGE